MSPNCDDSGIHFDCDSRSPPVHHNKGLDSFQEYIR